jgi:hypothetical protein
MASQNKKKGRKNNERQEQEGQRKGPETKRRQTATEDNKETGETTQKSLLTVSAVMRQRIHMAHAYKQSRQGKVIAIQPWPGTIRMKLEG